MILALNQNLHNGALTIVVITHQHYLHPTTVAAMLF
jgi:hypothetical protein